MVIKLDKIVEQDVVSLRRRLLRSIGVKEFATEAMFNDPFNSFVIPMVFCSYCNGSRNMDFCSDYDLQESVGVNEKK